MDPVFDDILAGERYPHHSTVPLEIAERRHRQKNLAVRLPVRNIDHDEAKFPEFVIDQDF